MNTPFENLANAIIMQAVKDYREALRILSINPNNNFAAGEIKSIESFFSPGYFRILTKLDPEMLIKKIIQ